MGAKALIAMSGGVDSSVAVYLMKQRGFECTGVMMKLFENEDIGLSMERTCCSQKDAEDERNAAYALGIPFYVHNLALDFKEQVIDRFIDAYLNGSTPNPCIDCNRYMKFEQLYRRAKQLGMDCFATGHYARIKHDGESKRHVLCRAIDETKDQSYVLYSMTQEQLAQTAFPLGELRKQDVRELAVKEGLGNANKKDSQDICFVRGGDYAAFIKQYAKRGCEPGDFIDVHGNALGKHNGIIHYTIGQRRGLGLSFAQPMYVLAKNMTDNTVTLCEDHELYAKTLDAEDFNWVSRADISKPIRIKAKIRYAHTPQWAVATQTSQDTVRVVFEEPQRAIARGQAAVLYDGDAVVGGGTIK